MKKKTSEKKAQKKQIDGPGFLFNPDLANQNEPEFTCDSGGRLHDTILDDIHLLLRNNSTFLIPEIMQVFDDALIYGPELGVFQDIPTKHEVIYVRNNVRKLLEAVSEFKFRGGFMCYSPQVGWNLHNAIAYSFVNTYKNGVFDESIGNTRFEIFKQAFEVACVSKYGLDDTRLWIYEVGTIMSVYTPLHGLIASYRAFTHK